MRNDEAQRAAVFGGERQAIVRMRENNVGLKEIGKRNVRRVAFFGQDQRVFRGVSRLHNLQNFGEEHTGPAIVEAAPARNAMEVGSDFGLRKGEKFLPGKACGCRDLTGEKPRQILRPTA